MAIPWCYVAIFSRLKHFLQEYSMRLRRQVSFTQLENRTLKDSGHYGYRSSKQLLEEEI